MTEAHLGATFSREMWDGRKISMELQGGTLDEMVQSFRGFLVACGVPADEAAKVQVMDTLS